MRPIAELIEKARKVTDPENWWTFANLKDYFPDPKLTDAERRYIAALDPPPVSRVLAHRPILNNERVNEDAT